MELIAAVGGGWVIEGSVGAGGGLRGVEARRNGEAEREAAGPRDEEGQGEAGREGAGAAKGGGGDARGRRREDRRHSREVGEGGRVGESSSRFFCLESGRAGW